RVAETISYLPHPCISELTGVREHIYKISQTIDSSTGERSIGPRLAKLASASAVAIAVATASTTAFAQTADSGATQPADASTAAAQPADTSAPGAQTADTQDKGAIVITGIRASLRSALQMKRNTDVISDNISSQQIGQLPDVTIAEELNRLPGVNTTRDRGNSSQAALRGLGPRFVFGLVNGREIASSEPSQDLRWEEFPA